MTNHGNKQENKIPTRKDFTIKDGVLVGYDGPGGYVAVPFGITAIGDRAFAYRTDLTVIAIPEGVTRIGMGAFEYCTGLENVTIPSSMVRISSGAFDGCSALARVLYGGTEEQWDAAEIAERNGPLRRARICPEGGGPRPVGIRVIDGEEYLRLDDLGNLADLVRAAASTTQSS